MICYYFHLRSYASAHLPNYSIRPRTLLAFFMSPDVSQPCPALGMTKGGLAHSTLEWYSRNKETPDQTVTTVIYPRRVIARLLMHTPCARQRNSGSPSHAR
jgi:hypothetical protein